MQQILTHRTLTVLKGLADPPRIVLGPLNCRHPPGEELTRNLFYSSDITTTPSGEELTLASLSTALSGHIENLTIRGAPVITKP